MFPIFNSNLVQHDILFEHEGSINYELLKLKEPVGVVCMLVQWRPDLQASRSWSGLYGERSRIIDRPSCRVAIHSPSSTPSERDGLVLELGDGFAVAGGAGACTPPPMTHGHSKILWIAGHRGTTPVAASSRPRTAMGARRAHLDTMTH